jgi:hypothetical protein
LNQEVQPKVTLCGIANSWKEVKTKMKEIKLEVVELEERIAPDVAPGLLGYEGQPGNQGGGGGGNGLNGYEGQPGNQGGANHNP